MSWDFRKMNKGAVAAVAIGVVLGLILAFAAVFGLGLMGSSENQGASSEISTSEPYYESSSESNTTSTESVEAVVSPLPEIKLSITSHKRKDITTTEPSTTFIGLSDPDYPLYINGAEIKRSASGAFSVEFNLNKGANSFEFSHKGERTVYIVRYKYIVMKSFSPSSSQKYESGAAVAVVVIARRGSRVAATFQGKTITLTEMPDKNEGSSPSSESFLTYSGSFSLPNDNATELNLGKISISATRDGITNTGSSGNIICKKANLPVVAEIVTYSAETFSGNTVDDASRPTNNYLPQGTVDYVVGHTYYGTKEYLNLRCGRRVYVSKSNTQGNAKVPVAKQYIATLPENNNLSVVELTSEGRFTKLVLNTDWKAPFLLDLLPQSYTNPSKQLYTVDSVTCRYVEIKFCYAASLEGNIEFAEDHPLFTRAEIIKGKRDYTLRLYLKRVGGFYGWDANYNDQGQLVFKFLHPAVVTDADNQYGVDLTGITVLVDVGHGGKDVGAIGPDSTYPESERNLFLAKLIQRELESVGATVVLNRTEDVQIEGDDRCRKLKELWPDLCVAVHHDASASAKVNGFGSFHSTLFSREAARCIYEATMSAGIYNGNASGNRNRFEWHYYYVARMSNCPVVLTENGFMTNQNDFAGIVKDTVNEQKASAIVKGIVNYFLSIRS